MNLIKAGSAIEAQKKIIGIRQKALFIQEDNIQLRNSLIELKQGLKNWRALMETPVHDVARKPGYWIQANLIPNFDNLGGIQRTYKCSKCDFTESIILTPK